MNWRLYKVVQTGEMTFFRFICLSCEDNCLLLRRANMPAEEAKRHLPEDCVRGHEPVRYLGEEVSDEVARGWLGVPRRD